MKIQPLGDRVLVKPINEKGGEQGGIVIPDTAKEKPQEAEVLQEARQDILLGVEKPSKAVKTTLGPRGRNVVLEKSKQK